MRRLAALERLFRSDSELASSGAPSFRCRIFTGSPASPRFKIAIASSCSKQMRLMEWLRSFFPHSDGDAQHLSRAVASQPISPKQSGSLLDAGIVPVHGAGSTAAVPEQQP